MGIAGRIAQRFFTAPITPLLVIVGLLMGLFAVLVTPREEEPQIDVTFANVFIAYPGASAKEVEQLISVPAEQVLSEIEGVEHIYSVSQPGLAVLTVQFKVGQARTQAIVRLYNAVFSHQDWLPLNLGVAQPIVKPKGIDDVPIVNLTLWSKDPQFGGQALQQVAHAIEVELKRIPGTRDIYTIGGPQRIIHILIDPARLGSYGLDIGRVKNALHAGNQVLMQGRITKNNEDILLQAGSFYSDVTEMGDLVIAVQNNRPVFLKDIARIRDESTTPNNYVWHAQGPGSVREVSGESFPAVTVAIAKKPGSNAAVIAQQIIERIGQLRGVYIPESVEVSITRNYGASADEKATTLVGKLAFATTAVIVLVLLSLGWREAIVVGVAVVVTLAVTLFASWMWGFTLNRVSLFALIFSIGILVDDAIVVVENIHRHIKLGDTDLLNLIPKAVDEVGGPTLLATFTVIAALLPMAFVSGLMGPYMSPIPINASLGMLISLLVAFTVTPWFIYKLLRHHTVKTPGTKTDSAVSAFFKTIFKPFLTHKKYRRNRFLLLGGTALLIIMSLSLVTFKWVILKMLPFDNKSEFQVMVDMPEGTALARTAQVVEDLGSYLLTVAEVKDYQAYVGTASPINFNGLVRQYYLRQAPHQADIQVNLVHKNLRQRKSHVIAMDVRQSLQAIAAKYQANVKIVEVPPGPPVLAPIVAEIYGLDAAGRVQLAEKVQTVLRQTSFVVDVDDSVAAPAQKYLLEIDRNRAAFYGLQQAEIVEIVQMAFSGLDVSYFHDPYVKYPVPIRLEFDRGDQADLSRLLSMVLPGKNGQKVVLGDIVRVLRHSREQVIYHKDLLPLTYVVADAAGAIDSPLYGMFTAMERLSDHKVGSQTITQYLIAQPNDPYQYSIKWDGEWQITYETFRDMGIAYGVGILLIYLLTVIQFRSYLIPLIIMVPIPLTIIGVMPGHALMGAQFTATSMIGMIALAGIIVRNSILLVDFIGEQLKSGISLEEAVIQSSSVRAKPIVLTALAAILGALFILDDPIFNGLAVTLIFGILVSTLLTLVIIPLIYYMAMKNKVVR